MSQFEGKWRVCQWAYSDVLVFVSPTKQLEFADLSPSWHVFGTFIHSHAGLSVCTCRAIEPKQQFSEMLGRSLPACFAKMCISEAFWCVAHINVRS